eukprot:scaffold1736_cov127-Cylindrotheca_fusiformis.AAC.87
MGKLRWNDADPQVFVVPRLEDEQIDELFYQEDEIGDMRHTAFMIECGLEEDPPDGPDVPPIPWKAEDLKKMGKEKKPEETSSRQKSPKKDPPKRTYSMDEGLEDLEESLPLAAKKPEPRRRIVASKSGSLHSMRRSGPPSRSMSVDTYGRSGPANLSVALARTEKRKAGVPTRRKLAATQSGSLHEMRKNLDKMSEEAPKPASSPRRASKLVTTKSGNLHGMRKALEEKTTTSPLRDGPKRRTLGNTRSGARSNSLESLSEDGKDSKSLDSGSTSDSFLLSDIESESHGSDVSIQTDVSSTDEPKPKANGDRKPSEILKDIKKDKEKKKKKKSSKDKDKEKDKDKKSSKVKKKSSKDSSKADGDSEKKTKKAVKKFKVKKANPEDLPPAFRHCIAK